MNQEVKAKVEGSKERSKRWREANKERIREYQKEWRERNAKHVAEYQREYQSDYKDREDIQFKTWMRNLHKNYQMTPAIFNQMWADQDGSCGICKQPMLPRGRSKSAATVDHNHNTGKVRGLLCRSCNHGIGNLKDDPNVLQSAADYLLKHGNYSHIERKSK